MNGGTVKSDIEVSDSLTIPVNPIVSVAMITYGHEEFLAQAIESIVNQKTDFPFELIIAEDCSKDRTREIALDYQKKYPNIIRIIYSENNVGASNNFARCLYACRGQYVAICDGDDYWNDVSKLQKQVDFLNNNSDYVVCYHDSAAVSGNGEYLAESMFEGRSNLDFTNKQLIMFGYMPTSTILFRNVIRELPVEYFKVTNGDAFLFSMLGNYGGAKYLDSISPAVYRIHAGGIWSGINQFEKNIKLSESYYWMSVYYDRILKHDIASEWACVAMWHIASSIKIKKTVFLRWSLARSFVLFKSQFLKIFGYSGNA